MGNYNPHKPQILGEEWVPIREENLQYNQIVNNVELGHTFTLDSSGSGFVGGRFYVNQLPDALVRNQVWTMAVYNRGEEDQSGPIQRVVIPVNDGAIAGVASAVVYRNCADTKSALADPSDRKYIEMQLGFGNQVDVNIYFDVNRYQQLLQGKRILGVNLLYSGEAFPDALDDAGQTMALQFFLKNATGTNVIQYPPLISGNNPSVTSMSPFVSRQITRIALGDTNMFFNPTIGVDAIEGIPWNFSSLRRFENSDPSHIEMRFTALPSAGDGPHWSMDWAGLEVIYCEEKRIAVGSTLIGFGSAGTAQQYRLGWNGVNLYTPEGAITTIPGNGDYTLTLAQGSLGDSPLVFTVTRIGPQPKLNALRELYSLEPQVGVQLNIPAPATDDVVGQVFSTQPTHVLPQLSLLNTGNSAALKAIHAYGRQSIAQVWGSKFASQRIDDSGVTPTSYPQVKFWARRFGNTTVPLTMTGPTTETAFISPSQFDALPPIIDGWKEIVLQMSPAPTMGSATYPTFTWTASGETAGNRWEVLGAVAPTQAAVPGINLTETYELGPATYGAPASGAQILEFWMPQSLPPVSGTQIDNTADVAVYFSPTLPTITSLAAVTQNQALSGIGLNCGIPPQFIPTALQYNRITWAPNTQYYFADLFNRTSVNSWGTSTSGAVYVAGGTASQFQVSAGTGRLQPTSTVAPLPTYVPVANFNARDVRGYAEISSDIAASGGSHYGGVYFRGNGLTDTFNGTAQVIFQVGGTVAVGLMDRHGGSNNQVSTVTQLAGYVPGTKVKLRFQMIGGLFQAKIWYDGTAEPAAWQLSQPFQIGSMTDGTIGTKAQRSATGPVATLSFSNLFVQGYDGGYMELQRRDVIGATTVTDWQTIMKATNMSVSGFNDYEARIGIQSDYRIRYVNLYGFIGPWSSTASNTISAPGVTATSLGASDHVYVYTTNEVQDGSRNLAYSPAFQGGSVTEDFNFPESAGQTFQTMYGRNYVTAFRSTERGGVNFTRPMLVQAAAIAPETLEDFTSLRDMAWANVSYICVRDEEGNRWFANVSVPTGTVLRDRRLYMAPVSIVEVTDTSSVVDP